VDLGGTRRHGGTGQAEDADGRDGERDGRASEETGHGFRRVPTPLPPVVAPLMRIAVDLTSLLDAPTGVAAVLRHHLLGLRERAGAEVVGFAASWRGRDRLAEEVPAGAVDRLVRRPMAARPLRLAWSRTDHPRIERWTGDIDVVWGPNFVVPPSAAARLATVHDLTCVRHPELCTADVLQYPALLRRAVASGAHLHAVSQFVADEVLDVFGVDPDHVHVVPNGVDADAFGHGDAARGRALAGGERYVLALGTVEPRKDHPALVRAFDTIVGDDPDLKLVLAGPDGWGANALGAALGRSVAVRLGRVERLGFVSDDDRADLLAGAVCLAYPSLYEGYGLPPLEAMAAGTAVVATDAGALPEVLGDAAVLVPVGDTEALAAALLAVAGDAARRADLVARGRARAAAASWDTSRQAFVQLLVELARAQ
jgi:glycosyltransferase involved in cell wall biosynthesis